MAQPNLSTHVESTISCIDLVKLDLATASDPIVFIQTRNPATKKWQHFDKTERIKNKSNPKFAKQISIEYKFEESQPLRFVVLDADREDLDGNRLKSFDKIGKIKCQSSEIISAPGGTFVRTLENKKHPHRKNGNIAINFIEINRGLEGWNVKWQWSGSGLDKKDLFGKSDPYLVFERFHENGSFLTVHKTPVIKNTLNPDWDLFEIPISRLAPASSASPIRITCFDWDAHGTHDSIGSVSFTVDELRAGRREFSLINEEKKHKKGHKYTDSGRSQLRNYTEYKKPSFLDYSRGGTEVSSSIAIDYTGSNGNPKTATSLHYFDPNGVLNEYASAIRVVGDICAPYDRSGMFPVYGFGATIDNVGGDTKHCFEVNRNPQDPRIPGIDGVLTAYRESFSWLNSSGPTYFGPLLDRINSVASQRKDGSVYHLLLSLTDGVINDVEQTIRSLRLTSDLPVSIIIVGVGSADFSGMSVLDDDDGRSGLKRDCVQFVPFREFKNGPISALAAKTLMEVPAQVVQFMMQHGINPRPPPVVNPLPNPAAPVQ